MPLPTSGTITLANLQTEFGGANPISLSEYYRGGTYVPNTATNAGVPTSGAIALSNFYGASAVTFYNWTRYATVEDTSENSASQITLSFNTNGTVTYTKSAGDMVKTDLTHWHGGGTVTGIGNSRWAKKTSVGDPTSGTLTTTLVALSAARTLSISTSAGEARSGQEIIEIYSDSGGTTKVGEINLIINANV